MVKDCDVKELGLSHCVINLCGGSTNVTTGAVDSCLCRRFELLNLLFCRLSLIVGRQRYCSRLQSVPAGLDSTSIPAGFHVIIFFLLVILSQDIPAGFFVG